MKNLLKRPLKRAQEKPNKKTFRVSVRSRHPSHSGLRHGLPRMPFRSVVRLGSQTELPDNGRLRIELNTPEAVANSADKLRMKQCFDIDEVSTAVWTQDVGNDAALEYLGFPIVIKHRFGSRGEWNFKVNSLEEAHRVLSGKTLNNYIAEKYHSYTREYRLHVASHGCFYACRKLLKDGTPESERWYRNDSNCVWILEDNPSFDKPVNWDDIVSECIIALESVGLDFGACDVKVQSATDKNGDVRLEPFFFIIEINSAPSFGEITEQKYLEEIPKMLLNKYKLYN